MSWPTPQEYNEAVQNPRANFRDAELRACSPELTPLGLPRPITGNFASVYRLTTSGRALAVRCFFREYADMRARYSAISAHLRRTNLPYTVGFTYLDGGIAVRQSPYPVLKMDWVEGQLLDAFVCRNLRNSRALRDLADRWVKLAVELGRHSMAHGDLQHGNVLIVGGAIRLVDYDGMFVPSLAGKPSLELGHPSYQHPRRDGSLFGPAMDNFSHWVIYTSLVALATDPDLWDQLEAGDERLLFSRSDFADTSTSRAFQALTTHTSTDVRALALRLRQFTELPPARVPPLDPVVAASVSLRRRHVRPTNRGSFPNGPPSALPEWVAEQVSRPEPADFPEPGALPRVGLALCCGAFAVQIVPQVNVLMTAPGRVELSGGAAGLACLILTGSYLRDGNVRDLLRLRAARIKVFLSWSWLQSRMGLLQRQKESLDRDMEAAREQVARAGAAAEARKTHMRADIQQLVRSSLEPLKQSLEQLRLMQEEELAGALNARRRAQLEGFLRDHTLRAARIKHIGLVDKARLWAYGVRSAADVDPARASVIERLGVKPAAALTGWRAGLVRQGMRSLPTEAPLGARDRIGAKYERRRRRIDRLRKRVLLDATPVLTAISGLSAREIERASERFQAVEASVESRRASIESREAEVALRQVHLIRRAEEIDLRRSSLSQLTLPRFLLRVLLGRRFRMLQRETS